MNFAEVFVIFVMVASILMYVRSHYGEVVFVRSDIDGRRYLVRMLPDRQAAADSLADLNKKLTRLVQHMVAKYGTLTPSPSPSPSSGPKEGGDDDGGGGTHGAQARKAAAVNQLFENYNPDALSEGGMEVGYTSYSVNKGERIVMCLRQSDNTFVDDNVLLYVAVHELGHLMTSDVGHTDSFWSNFKWLLTEAVELGIYRKEDYAKKPQPYCGISVSSSVI